MHYAGSEICGARHDVTLCSMHALTRGYQSDRGCAHGEAADASGPTVRCFSELLFSKLRFADGARLVDASVAKGRRHDVRQTATILTARGVDSAVIQTLLGRSSVATIWGDQDLTAGNPARRDRRATRGSVRPDRRGRRERSGPDTRATKPAALILAARNARSWNPQSNMMIL